MQPELQPARQQDDQAGVRADAAASARPAAPSVGATAVPALLGRFSGLRSRLLLLLAVILLLTTATTIAFLVALGSVEAALDKIVGFDVPRLNLAVRLSAQVQTAVAQVPVLARAESDNVRDGVHARFVPALKAVEATLAALRQAGADGAAIGKLDGYLQDLRGNEQQLGAIVARRLALEHSLADSLEEVNALRHRLRAMMEQGQPALPVSWQLDALDLIEHTALAAQLNVPQELHVAVSALEARAASVARRGDSLPAAQRRLNQEIAAACEGEDSPARLRLASLRLNYLLESRLSINSALSDRFIEAASELGRDTQANVASTANELRAQLRRHQGVSIFSFVAILGGILALLAYIGFFMVRRLVLIRDNIRAYLAHSQPAPIPPLGNDEIGEIARALNFFVHTIRERELALNAEKASAEQAYDNLRSAQSQLVQSEKMASLGQLVASVAHEINTPLGAVKSSGRNIADALEHTLVGLPALFRVLDAPTQILFTDLIAGAARPREVLSTREERALVRELEQQLAQRGVDNIPTTARVLVQLNASADIERYLPLLVHARGTEILEVAYGAYMIMHNTHNINIAVERVAKIVFALKSYSRVDPGGAMAETDLRQGIETVLTLYQNQIKHGITLVRNFELIAPLRCLADELNQVWTNLIHNALHAMDYRGTLTIGIRREGELAVVSVGDSGCGIPDAVRGRIFEAFFTTKPAGEGSGLGLDIVKKIVDKHNGRIEVDSQVGVGTTFRVYLPYAAGS